MKSSNFKLIVIIIVLVIALILISLFNKNVIKKNNSPSDKLSLELLEKINHDDIDSIDYDYLIKNLSGIDDFLKKEISGINDISKKTEYYDKAANVYENRLNEIVWILNKKLNEDDFARLNIDLDEFYKNLDIAIDEIKNTLSSSVDALYYSNKYEYEEKQKKCREILENYKGYLK